MKKTFIKVLSVILTITALVSTFSAAVSALPNYEDEYGAFLEKLGYYESRNNYTIKNEYGYMGRWQLGHMALQDIGFMDSSYKYTSLAASYGVQSDEDFLNTPSAQDYCVLEVHKKMLSYIKYYGDEQYIGQTKWDIKITLSGLIASAHLVGAGALHNMLKTGVVATDANGAKATFYLKELAGYNISKSLGTTITDAPATPPTPAKTESYIHFYENYSGSNYLLGTDFSSSINSEYLKSRNTDVYKISIDKTNTYENENSLKIVGSSAGAATKDLYWATQTSPGTNEGYAGDSKNMTLSFYAKATVSGAKMYWRFGYGSEYSALELTTAWKKYTLSFKKKTSDGNVLHPYFSKAGTFYLNNVTLVDGSTAATLTSHESKTAQYSSQKGTIGKTFSSLPTPTRSGYTFDGWFTQKFGGTKITTSTTVPSGDINAYAHWTKNVTYIPVKTSTYNNHYYSVFNDEMSWSDARTACAKMGGHLVTIENYSENNFVKNLVASQGKGMYWLGCKSTSSGWAWVTGESFSYKNWASGQPSGESYGEMYAKSAQGCSAGTWNDVNLTTSEISYYSVKNTGFVCEFEPENISYSKTYYNNGSLYRVYDSQISWENANNLSKYVSGHLVTIGSAEESSFVNSIAQNGGADSYWIGLYDKNGSKTYSWVTGESLSYKNWSSGNPSSSGSIERYVELYSDSKWNDVKNIGRNDAKTGCIIEYDNYQLPVQSLTVVSKPAKTTYVQGESFNSSGLVIRANYGYGVSKNVTGYSLSGYDKNTVGTQTITVSYEGVKTQFSISVVKNTVAVTSVSISKTSLSLKKGDKYTLTATVLPTNASNKSVIWTSDNTSVASVTSEGVVTALNTGKAVITVKTSDGSYKAQCTVSVTAPAKALPSSLIIVSKPNKTVYNVGENLDLKGMEVKVKYDDGTYGIVTNYCDVLGFDSSTAAQLKLNLVYSESGKTVTNSFTVFIGRDVKAIYITSKPDKTTYVMGEPFDKTGMVITAKFSDGTTKDVTSMIRTSGYESTSPGLKKLTVRYTYNGKTVTNQFSYQMNPKLSGIVITSKPSKLTYIMGESFRKDGMVITASFTDGSTKDVTHLCTTSGFDVSCPGTKTMSVMFTYATQTAARNFTIIVKPRMTALTLASKPSKLTYNRNEALNTKGMRVVATFWDGTEASVTDKVKITGYDSSVAGKQYLTVFYTYGTVTLSKQFSVIVK